MDREIIRKHNLRVKPTDTVFFLGDFCFKSDKKENKAEQYLSQLNGRFIFIKGNHDNPDSLRTVIKHIVIEHGGREMFLVHYPEDFNDKYKINLVGHIHNRWAFKEKGRADLINVGVDVCRFMPVNIHEILKAHQLWKKGFLNNEGKWIK